MYYATATYSLSWTTGCKTVIKITYVGEDYYVGRRAMVGNQSTSEKEKRKAKDKMVGQSEG